MLDVKRLRLLRELQSRGTIVAVADAMNYTPSAVSQQLAALEREAGVPLLERVGRGVRITGAGRTLVEHAEAVLERLEQAEADLAAAGGGVTGTVRVASFQTGAGRIVAPAIIRLSTRFPRLRVELVEMEAEDSLPQLRLGEVDIAVAEEYEHAPRRRHPAVERVDLGRDTLKLVLAGDHPAAEGGRPVPLRRMATEAWIGAGERTRYAEMIERECRVTGGFEPDIRHRTDDIALILTLAARGLGVSLVPTLGRPEEHPEVAVRDLTGRTLDRSIFAGVRRGSASHPRVAAVLDELRDGARAAGLV